MLYPLLVNYCLLHFFRVVCYYDGVLYLFDTVYLLYISIYLSLWKS